MFDTCQGKLGLNTTAPDPASGFPSNVGLTSTDSSGDEVTETTENPEVSVDPESEQVNVWPWVCDIYSVFHQFRQFKFAYGGFDFKLKPILATAPADSKNNACHKSG